MDKFFPILNIDHFPTGKHERFYANDIVNHIQEHRDHISKPHKHDFYLTVIFTGGTGIHEIDFTKYEVKAGSVFLMKPGQTHFWTLSEDISGFVILHSKDFFDLNYASRTLDNFPFFYSSLNSPHIYLKNPALLNITAYFKLIYNEYRSDKKYKHQKINSLVDLLYIDLSRLYIPVSEKFTIGTSSQMSQLKKLEQLIELYYLTEKSPKFYAEKMHISTRHLNRLAQVLLNKTTSTLITERVLLEAQRILSSSDITIAELAFYLGYKDQAYFSRLFKNKLGIEPSKFSKKYSFYNE